MPIVIRGPKTLTDGLVARYLFTSGPEDSTGTHNDAIEGLSVTYSSDGVRLQKATTSKLRFDSDGNTAHLTTTLNDLSSNNGTISFWIKPNSNIPANGIVDNVFIFGSYRGDSANNRGPHFGFFDANNTVDSGNGGWHFWSKVSQVQPYEGADWLGDSGTDYVHIVLTLNGTSIKMYGNGVLRDSYTANSGWPIDNVEWEINGVANNFDTTKFFDGWFKDLSVWSGRTLSAEEVSTLYSTGHGGSY